MEQEKPRSFKKGTRVEIAPWRAGNKFTKLKELDGATGRVVSVKDHGPEMTVFVKLDRNPGAIGYPAAAVRPIPEEEE